MFAQVLIVTFVLCLGLTAATVLVSRQLISSYASPFLRHHFYYLAAVQAFAFYGLWGQILTRAVLGVVNTDRAVVNLVAVLVPVLGVPFLLVSWAMLLNMAGSMFGKAIKPAWHSVHGAVFALLLLGAWTAVGRLQGVRSASPLDILGVIEAAAMIGIELVYVAAFLVLVWRFRLAVEGDKRRVLLVFAALLCGAFVARSLLAALVLVDIRLGAIALLAFHGANLPALLY